MDTSLIVAFLGVVVSIISWFAGKRERRAKTYSIEIENVKKVWDIVNYQTGIIEDLQQEVVALKKEIERMCSHCEYKKLQSFTKRIKNNNHG